MRVTTLILGERTVHDNLDRRATVYVPLSGPTCEYPEGGELGDEGYQLVRTNR